MHLRRSLNTKLLVVTPLLALLFVVMACGGTAPAEPIIVEKEVIKEVEKPVVVEKEVIKEVEKPVVVEKEVIKEVEVVKEIVREVLVNPTQSIHLETGKGLEAAAETVTGPVVPSASGTPRLGGIAVCQAYSAPTFFDVHRGAAANDVLWDSPMYNGLIELNPETDDFFDLRGDLATSWEVTPDGLGYVFKLHPDATWWDGEPVTSEDAVWSLDRMIDPNESRPRAGLIKPYYKNSEAIDPHTVQVNTNFVSAAFGGYLGSDYMKIFPKHVYAPAPDGQGVDANNWETIVGSGPFKLTKYRKSESGEFLRNENYFRTDSEGRRRPYLDQIDIHRIEDRGSVAAAVRTGRIEFSCGGSRIDLDDLLVLAEEMGADLNTMRGGKLTGGKLNVYLDLPGGFGGFWMNTNIEPYNDVRVRKAIHLATDRDEIIQAIGPIGTELLGTPMLPNSWFGKSQEDIRKLPGFRQPKDEDIAEAIRLMKEAGYGPDNPVKHVLRFRNVVWYPRGAPVIKNQLRKIGFELELEQMESAAGFRAWQLGDADMALQGTSFGVFEADVVVNTFYLPKGGGVGGRNYPGYMPDPKVTELADKQARELDQNKRAEILQELEDHILNNMDSAWIGAFWRGSGRFALDHIKNYWLAQSGQGELKFEHIWTEK